MKIEQNIDLKKYSSMVIGGQAKYFALVESEDDLSEVLELSKKENIPLYIVGDGTNIIWSEKIHDMMIVKVNILGIKILEENEDFALVEVGAGENWDGFVGKMVEKDFSGIEAMSAIPGTVGATPVQNVGAYGQEVKDTIVEVSVYDTQDKSFKKLSNKECGFSYRGSIFKNDHKGRYIILSIIFKLNKNDYKIPDYPGVQKYFEENHIKDISLRDIREAIVQIRKNKLPDPKIIPNCGSFFENVLVDEDTFTKIKTQYPDIKYFQTENGQIKIPTGWLLEKCDLKGKYVGKLKLHDQNALVLTNPDGAGFDDLLDSRKKIINIVKEKFGLDIDNEPNIIY